MALIAYCSPDEVRAALGVSDIELTDTVIALPVYEMGLTRELNKVSTSLPAAFYTVSAVAVNSRSTLQENLFEAVRLFSVYACARQVGASLGIMAPKDIGDGKATLSRFSDGPYRDTLDRIDIMYHANRANVASAWADYSVTDIKTPSTKPFTVFAKAIRNYDPVTG